MSNREKMLDMNQQILSQTTQIKSINRVAEEASETSNNILRELDSQRIKIQRNIDMNDEIKTGVRSAQKTTNKMRNRAICIKCTLYIAIIALFALILALVITKLSKKS